MTTATESGDRERYEATLRAEQRALITECDRLESQLQAHQRRLKEIWKLLIVRPLPKKESEET